MPAAIKGTGYCRAGRIVTFARFLKPTVRMSKAVKARDAEFRISHAAAAMASIAVATPAWCTKPLISCLP